MGILLLNVLFLVLGHEKALCAVELAEDKKVRMMYSMKIDNLSGKGKDQ